MLVVILQCVEASFPGAWVARGSATIKLVHSPSRSAR